MLTSTPGNFWDYAPSKPAAYIFAVLYTIPAAYTVYQYISLRCWFWIFMVIAAVMEAVGYIGRVVSVHKPTVLGVFPRAIHWPLQLTMP